MKNKIKEEIKENKYFKIFEKCKELCELADKDELIYGNSYLEFGERSIELIDPKNIEFIRDKKGFVTQIKNKAQIKKEMK